MNGSLPKRFFLALCADKSASGYGRELLLQTVPRCIYPDSVGFFVVPGSHPERCCLSPPRLLHSPGVVRFKEINSNANIADRESGVDEMQRLITSEDA